MDPLSTKSSSVPSRRRGQPPSPFQLKTSPKGRGAKWTFYTTTLPNGGRLRFYRRDVSRIVAHHPEGLSGVVKITITKTGRFFMHAALYVRKQQVQPKAEGQLVSLDPGSNSFITYYLPTRMTTGSFGTSIDLQKTFRPKQDRLDQINSLLDKNSTNGSYLPLNVRHRLTTRRLRIHEQVRNRHKNASTRSQPSREPVSIHSRLNIRGCQDGRATNHHCRR
ncbi:hypothetical protein DFS34DRAFT_676551 [Phlyctochytrium arcticum]|nr:hypothetical protein DFS34DRAFT_676551 [Phlyctochytrium arcticum]